MENGSRTGQDGQATVEGERRPPERDPDTPKGEATATGNHERFEIGL